ncbi:hypothetical protein HY636_05410 [Candidatus Woesearchaeota archaeon]|nr:hypothetical protein [Candidatus Woesearchaeota archaeon]
METISLKMEETLLKDIDGTIKKHRYSTRTEFIRDAIRGKLTKLEKEEAIKRLTAMKGILKGKGKLSDEEAGELAVRNVAKKFGIKLD